MRHSHSSSLSRAARARPQATRALPARAGLLALATVLAVVGSWSVLPAGRAAADPGGQVQGMVVSGLGQTESPATAMARLHADGVNTVSLFVWWWTDSPTSTSLRPYEGTESDADLTNQIEAARALGMKVILTPVFDCGGCDGGFRGVMHPSDVTAFFASYRTFIDHYAQLAQNDGVWLLFGGSELSTVENVTDQWDATFASIRQYFSGLVGYEENWDVLGHAQFLSDVDVVGVSAYFPLDDAAEPGVSQLVGDWSNSQASAYAGRNWIGDLEHMANATGKPILFGESGYMASQYAGRQPFMNAFYTPDPQVQANLYQALLQALSGYSWWMGVAWWEWSDNPGDAQRTPMGQPAEQLLAKWYGQGWRPGSGTPTTPGGSGPVPTVPVPGGSTAAGGSGVGVSGMPTAPGSAPSATLSNAGPGSGASGAGSAPAGIGAAAGGAVGGGDSVPVSGSTGAGTRPAPVVPGTPSGGAFAPGQPSAAGVILTDTGPGSTSGRGAGFDALAVLAAAALFVLWATTLRQAALHPLVAPARARRRAAVVRAAHAPPRRGPRQGYRAPTRPS